MQVPRMPKGSIVLVHFPFTDLSSTKLRLSLVLTSIHLDVTIASMTTQRPDPPIAIGFVNTQRHALLQSNRIERGVLALIDKIATLGEDVH